MTNLDKYKGSFPWVDEIIKELEEKRKELDAAKEIISFWAKLVEQDRVFDPEELSVDEIAIWAESKKWVAKYSGPSKAGSGDV